jgi:hypothetical protein
MVYLDIKPGLCPNYIRMGEKAPLYVAICGTADFNVRDIDPKSIKIGRVGMADTVPATFFGYRDMATPYTGTCECWNRRADGRTDLILTFPTQKVINTLLLRQEPKDVPLPLQITGNLLDAKGGTPVVGQDNVRPMK